VNQATSCLDMAPFITRTPPRRVTPATKR
jgi:hypothetical protein